MKLRRTFGTLRGYIGKHYTRGDTKGLLIEAGCNPERMARIPVSGNMKAPNYKSMSAILSEGYDTIPEDFRDDEADPIIMALARLVLRRAKSIDEEERLLIEALGADGISVADLLGDAVPEIAAAAGAAAGAATMAEAARLANKAVSRLIEHDLDGAVTVAVAAVESAIQVAHDRLGIIPPAKKTLPNLLVSLRRQTNLVGLLGSRPAAERAVASLSTLVENLYLVSHAEGDRHGGTELSRMSNTAASLFVGAAATLLRAVASALNSGELKTTS